VFNGHTASHPLARPNIPNHGCAEAYLGLASDRDAILNRRTRPDPCIGAGPHVAVHHRSVANEDFVAEHAIMGHERAVPDATSPAEVCTLTKKPPRDDRVGEDVAACSDLRRPSVHQFDGIALRAASLESCRANNGAGVDYRSFTHLGSSDYRSIRPNRDASADDDIVLVDP
jgi:hypothetical protein